ncbi:hypothetical protein E2C01_003572 [Portunus trituberculatus]|uniref:Uncharacterized protein n=1 Tax=Portunus trituberculatus TaxID=210409 RepID=A0A5B7CP58_PORTR|nr:hypothetical protein [Portunus trituberculatus]
MVSMNQGSSGGEPAKALQITLVLWQSHHLTPEQALSSPGNSSTPRSRPQHQDGATGRVCQGQPLTPTHTHTEQCGTLTCSAAVT